MCEDVGDTTALSPQRPSHHGAAPQTAIVLISTARHTRAEVSAGQRVHRESNEHGMAVMTAHVEVGNVCLLGQGVSWYALLEYER